LQEHDEEKVKKALNIATAQGKTSSELSDFINKSNDEKVARDVATYLQDNRFGGDSYLSEVERQKLADRLNSRAQTEFIRTGILSSSSSQGGRGEGPTILGPDGRPARR